MYQKAEKWKRSGSLLTPKRAWWDPPEVAVDLGQGPSPLTLKRSQFIQIWVKRKTKCCLEKIIYKNSRKRKCPPSIIKTVPPEITCATRRNLQECVYCPQQNAKKDVLWNRSSKSRVKKALSSSFILEEMDEIRNGSKKLKREKWNYNPHWRRWGAECPPKQKHIPGMKDTCEKFPKNIEKGVCNMKTI